jgi:membrane-associated phospholipid phosphatase
MDRNGDAPRFRSAMGIAWAVCAIFAIVDLIWFLLSRTTFAAANFLKAGVGIVTLAGFYWITQAVSRRLEADGSRIAGGILHFAKGLRVLIRAAVFTLIFGFASITFMLLAASAAWPFRDAQLAAIDRALGFDWLSFLALTNSMPILSSILVWTYHSAGPQLLLLFLLLSFTGREQRLAEFLALLALTSLATGILMALVPAAGAYAYFDPPRHLFSNFSAHAGMWHYEFLQWLRTDIAPRLDFLNVQGLVTFPSFHTALAIITAYAVRDILYVARPALVLNAIVIVATLPEGGHHLVDLIVGAVIAAFAILIVHLHQAGSSLTPYKRAYSSVGPSDATPET